MKVQQRLCELWDVPARVGRSPLANTGDMGSVPGPGKFHVSPSNGAHAPELLSPRSRARGRQLLSVRAATADAPAPAACAPRECS